jgi:16S rRNA (guanine527-N7)-methyltransferase
LRIAAIATYDASVNPLWTEISARANINLSAEQHELLSRYLDLLLQANQTMNLTRITDRAAAEIQHIADALTLLPFIPIGPIALAEVGSGGGVPGIPLAIARPDAQITLIESTKKKAAFLRSVAESLNLKNVNVIDQRAEEVGRSNLRGTFDIVVARAVGQLVWLAEWCLPLTKKAGKVLAMKGAKIHEELPAALNAIHLLGGSDPIVHAIDLPGAEHHVVVEIQKINKTDSRYPRDPTTTKGKSLTKN